jgi:hypothetical protein
MCSQHYAQQNPIQATTELRKLHRNLMGNGVYYNMKYTLQVLYQLHEQPDMG